LLQSKAKSLLKKWLDFPIEKERYERMDKFATKLIQGQHIFKTMVRFSKRKKN